MSGIFYVGSVDILSWLVKCPIITGFRSCGDGRPRVNFHAISRSFLLICISELCVYYISVICRYMLFDREIACLPPILTCLPLQASGVDFYSSPRASLDGSRFAWTQWSHPNMVSTSSTEYSWKAWGCDRPRGRHDPAPKQT